MLCSTLGSSTTEELVIDGPLVNLGEIELTKADLRLIDSDVFNRTETISLLGQSNLVIDGEVTLTGDGLIHLAGQDVNIIASDEGGTLVNVDNSIDGGGTNVQIGNGGADGTEIGIGQLTLINSGTIFATTGQIVVDTGANEITNQGSLRAFIYTDNTDPETPVIKFGTLDIYSAVANSGTIAAEQGGAINLYGDVTNSGGLNEGFIFAGFAGGTGSQVEIRGTIVDGVLQTSN